MLSILGRYGRSFLVALLAAFLMSVPSNSTANEMALRYQAAQSSLKKLKTKWLTQYKQATNRKQKRKILASLGKILPAKIAAKMLEPWYGTRWAFHGTSRVPGKGTIACGYFVTTVLRDSGVRINRVRMAQVASEIMIRKVNANQNIKRYRQKSIQHFVNEVKKWGAGLYIVGLDFHTGFILNKDNKVYFIHSSYYIPAQVVSEKALTSLALKESKYRVIGKLFSDKAAVKRWLLN